jgi:hypothetical protein
VYGAAKLSIINIIPRAKGCRIRKASGWALNAFSWTSKLAVKAASYGIIEHSDIKTRLLL